MRSLAASAAGVLAFLVVAAPRGAPAQTPGAASGATDRLHALFQRAWEFRLREEPLFATRVGDHRYDDRLPRVREVDYRRRLGTLRSFRRELGEFEGFTAFTEGWALYAERLGLEAGFYRDPYADFGRLTYEMWRACRLVVDTGMHAFGWSRERAIEFMAENSALSRRNIEAEVDRYISWPGQALGYKMGELRIREVRSRARSALGPGFDLRAFHDLVLSQGSVPLEVLEGMVERWIEDRAGR